MFCIYSSGAAPWYAWGFGQPLWYAWKIDIVRKTFFDQCVSGLCVCVHVRLKISLSRSLELILWPFMEHDEDASDEEVTEWTALEFEDIWRLYGKSTAMISDKHRWLVFRACLILED